MQPAETQAAVPPTAAAVAVRIVTLDELETLLVEGKMQCYLVQTPQVTGKPVEAAAQQGASKSPVPHEAHVMVGSRSPVVPAAQ